MRSAASAMMFVALAGGPMRGAEPAATRPATLPVNKWVPMNEPSAGVEMLGWDEIRYVPDLGGVVFLGAYRGYTSENQNALWLYRFNENRWRLLDINLFWHRSEMSSDGGHTAGRLAFDEVRRVAVYGGLCSMNRNDRPRTWVFDPRAQVGWDARPLTPVPDIHFDAATIYVPELRGTLQYLPSRGTWLYDAVANRWTQIVAPGAGPTGEGCAEPAYDARRKRVLVFGGAQGHYRAKPFKTFNDLWAFDIEKKAWSKLETKNPPPGRGWPQLALSPDADVLLVAGGASGAWTPQVGRVMLNDVWALDLERLEWRELKDSQFPGGGISNHMAYDPADRVFLFLGPRAGMNYGYACGMYALRYEPARSAATPLARASPEFSIRNPKSQIRYDLAALTKPSKVWTDLVSGPLGAVRGWCFRPSLVSRGKDLLLSFTEYPEWPGPTLDPVFGVRVFRLTSGVWSELAGGDLKRAYPFLSQTPSVAFDSEGRAAMAYEGYRIWQRMGLNALRFNGSAWQTFGATPEGEKGGGFLPALVGGDTPAVAYQFHPKGLFGVAVTVIEQRDGKWQPVADGAPLNVGEPTLTRAEFPVLQRDGQGRLVVAWREHKPDWVGKTATPERIHVRRLENGKWMPLGDAVPVTKPEMRALTFGMALYQGEPVVATCEGTAGGRAALVVRVWQEGQWRQLAEAPLNLLGAEGGAFQPTLVSAGPSLYAAWAEFLPGRPPLLFVKQWDGRAWTLVGGPLNAAPGAGSAREPVMALLDGKPVVAWTEHNFEGEALRQLFVRTMK